MQPGSEMRWTCLFFFLSQLATSSVYSHAFQVAQSRNSSAKYFAQCHLKLLLANHLINRVQLWARCHFSQHETHCSLIKFSKSSNLDSIITRLHFCIFWLPCLVLSSSCSVLVDKEGDWLAVTFSRSGSVFCTQMQTPPICQGASLISNQMHGIMGPL